ncbi:MAG: hypothetical protein DCC71_13105 [Proteobacteria bacterium]|nr:MAG: hypothetical protein DCC71_13105 [Pseudomonadota bacterium]
MEPSIKGTVFAGVVEALAKCLAEGRVTEGELGRWLTPADRAALHEKILVSNWYPIESYRRINELLRDVVGHGGNEYLRELGRETARKLMAAGIYAQFEYLQRTEVANAIGAEAKFAAFGRDLRRITTLSSAILNFSKWTAVPDPEHQGGRYWIEVCDAQHFPEVLAWRSDGLINEMGVARFGGDMWRWDRPARDRIVFRMQRDL